jgi:hypothetical protein
MSIPVFLSFPKPHMQAQLLFVLCNADHLKERGREGRTLGENEYDMNAPLAGVRRLMLESNGALVVAFRRYWIENGSEKYGADIQAVKG